MLNYISSFELKTITIFLKRFTYLFLEFLMHKIPTFNCCAYTYYHLRKWNLNSFEAISSSVKMIQLSSWLDIKSSYSIDTNHILNRCIHLQWSILKVVIMIIQNGSNVFVQRKPEALFHQQYGIGDDLVLNFYTLKGLVMYRY